MTAGALLLVAACVSVALWDGPSQTKAQARGDSKNVSPPPPTGPATLPGEDTPATHSDLDANRDALDLLGSVAPYDRLPQTNPGAKVAQPVPVVFQVSQDNIAPIVKNFDAHQAMAVDLYDRDRVKKLGHGSLVGIDNQIDETTGTLKCKAIVLPVGDALLFPNQFVNVRLYMQPPGAGAPATQPEGAFVPRLQFRLVAEPGDKSDADEVADPDGKQPLRVLKTIELDERDVARAYSMKAINGERAVGVDFTEAGSKKFAALTGANIHHRLAIVFKGKLLSAPKIQTMILKSAVITSDGEFTDRQVQAVADAINSLTRPAPSTQPASAPLAQPADSGASVRPPDKAEVNHKKLTCTCIFLHGGTDLPGYAYVNPEAGGGKLQLSRLIEERERILNELSGYESRRDSLLRDLNEGRTPPDVEQRIRDTNTRLTANPPWRTGRPTSRAGAASPSLSPQDRWKTGCCRSGPNA